MNKTLIFISILFLQPVIANSNGLFSTGFWQQVDLCTHGKVSYAYTGGSQNFTVPSGCSSITVSAWGAGGGGSGGGGGAGSGASSGSFGVGGAGQCGFTDGAGGYNGGGNGCDIGGPGGGGGGGSSYSGLATNVSNLSGSGTTPPQTANSDYVAGVATGGAARNNGGHGRIVVSY